MGAVTGLPLGGFLADGIGWRWHVPIFYSLIVHSLVVFYRLFLIQAPVAMIAILAVSLALHLPKIDNSDLRAKLKRVDFAGAVTLVSTMFCLLFGLDRGANLSWDDIWTVISLAASVFLFILFAFIEMEIAKEPFAPKHLILNSSLIASFLVNFFGMSTLLTLLFNVSLYLQAVMQKTAHEAGLWLLPAIPSSVGGTLIGGLVIQKTGRYYTATLAAEMLPLFGSLVLTWITGIASSSAIGIFLGTNLCY